MSETELGRERDRETETERQREKRNIEESEGTN